MTKTNKVMLVFACIFATLTAILLTGQILIELWSMGLLFGKDADLGSAIGGIFIFIYSIMFGAAAIVGAVVTLPFDIVLLKSNGKKWYSLALLIFSIAAIVTAIVFFFMLPMVSEAVSRSSSSSIPSSSSY